MTNEMKTNKEAVRAIYPEARAVRNTFTKRWCIVSNGVDLISIGASTMATAWKLAAKNIQSKVA